MVLPDKTLQGLNVLVVEDESLVLLDVEDHLSSAGAQIVGPAMRLDAALQLVNSGADIDVALLDINIGGEQVYPVAAALMARNIPFVFASGYGRSGMAEDWRDYPIAQKPYDLHEVIDMLRRQVIPEQQAH